MTEQNNPTHQDTAVFEALVRASVSHLAEQVVRETPNPLNAAPLEERKERDRLLESVARSRGGVRPA